MPLPRTPTRWFFPRRPSRPPVPTQPARWLQAHARGEYLAPSFSPSPWPRATDADLATALTRSPSENGQPHLALASSSDGHPAIKHPGFYIASHKPLCFVDGQTKSWIRNAADERAAQEGCRFSERRGQFVVDWVSCFCILYEGDKAGHPMEVEDWQYEYFMQLFGWQVHDEYHARWIRRFRKASVWIPKKNAKSPTLAATGMYMLCADGELGQKCYSVARDGKQAMITHAHAMNMATASVERGLDCRVNNTTGTITHRPTKSKYLVVTGENQLSTEGYNGSLFVDETHVVDETLIGRLSRAGISRSEPLHVEMSTAGDSIDGYGSKQYDYSVRMQKGEVYNQGLYVLNFSIDQQTPIEKFYDRQFIADHGPSINPAAGRIFKPKNLMDDWEDSSQSMTELRRFAMYRFNLWTAAGANWIELADWNACAKEYTLADLQNYPCVGGLDLSKTSDMSAFTVTWAVPETIVVPPANPRLKALPADASKAELAKAAAADLLDSTTLQVYRPYTWTWHWIPEPAAKKYLKNVNFFDYYEDKANCLHIVRQKAIDYADVAKRMNWVRDNFDLHAVGYDVYNSRELMSHLYQEHGWAEEQLIMVRQNMSHMAAPTAETERLILRKEMRHPGTALMRWQMGHCQVYMDGNLNKRPIKPFEEASSYRKIDGVVSMIISQAIYDTTPTIKPSFDGSILLYNSEELNVFTKKQEEKRA